MTEPLPRPKTDDPLEWRAYWNAREMWWRSEPRIDAVRQAELAQHRERSSNAPFREIELSRADVEWLLERADVEWLLGHPPQSFNLTGAKLQDLSNLPLAQANLADAKLEGANLGGATLGGANLQEAHLREADLHQAFLLSADLRGAFLSNANLQEAVLREANLEGAKLDLSNLQGADLIDANLRRAEFHFANLQKADLRFTDLREANLTGADLREADLSAANLEGANLLLADLQGASLLQANLHGANLAATKLQGAEFIGTNLQGVNLRHALLDSSTRLDGVWVGKGPDDSIRVVDVRWGGANLAVVNASNGTPWSGVERLKDELKDEEDIDSFPAAIRAYRQLATALREQGLVDEANRFAYRGQVLRLQYAWREVREGRLHRLAPALGLGALWALAGFGYRPSRPLGWWILVILFGTIAFYYVDHIRCVCWPPGLPTGERLWSALIASINACHGRGVFFTETGVPTFSQGAIASVLAVFGLVIEATLIATFTQRFLGR